jgi:hypothetical protein
MADEIGQRENTIAGGNLQAILVAMPEINRSGLDLAKYTIRVEIVDGHTEVQLFPYHVRRETDIGSNTIAYPGFGSERPTLTTVILTPDRKHIANSIYCCR